MDIRKRFARANAGEGKSELFESGTGEKFPNGTCFSTQLLSYVRYCRALRRFEGRSPVLKLLRHGLMSSPPRRV